MILRLSQKFCTQIKAGALRSPVEHFLTSVAEWEPHVIRLVQAA